MKKRSRFTGYQLQENMEKKIMFPNPIYIPKDYEGDKFKAKVCLTLMQEWIKTDKQLKKYKKFTDIILKHITNNGWSNDFTIDFWNMNEKELKIINKFMNKYKEKK